MGNGHWDWDVRTSTRISGQKQDGIEMDLRGVATRCACIRSFEPPEDVNEGQRL